MKEGIERALRDAYPQRADPQWLDQVRELLRPRGEPVPRSAASATGLAASDANGLDRILGTNEGASRPAPSPPPPAPGRAGAGAGAPPPAADPWRIRPPGMGGAPHPVAFDPWSAPPAPAAGWCMPGRYALPCCRPAHHRGGRSSRRLASAGGLGRRRAPVLASRGDCPPVRYRGRVARGRGRAAHPPCRRVRLVRHAVARFARRPPPAQRYRPVGLRGLRRGQGRRRLARDGGAGALSRSPPFFIVTQPSVFRWGSCPHDEEEAATGTCIDNPMSKIKQYGNCKSCHNLMVHAVIHSTVVREFSTIPESRPGASVHARFRRDLGESSHR